MYEERRCEHSNWWYREAESDVWYKFTPEMLLKKLNETHDKLEHLKKELVNGREAN